MSTALPQNQSLHTSAPPGVAPLGYAWWALVRTPFGEPDLVPEGTNIAPGWRVESFWLRTAVLENRHQIVQLSVDPPVTVLRDLVTGGESVLGSQGVTVYDTWRAAGEDVARNTELVQTYFPPPDIKGLEVERTEPTLVKDENAPLQGAHPTNPGSGSQQQPGQASTTTTTGGNNPQNASTQAAGAQEGDAPRTMTLPPWAGLLLVLAALGVLVWYARRGQK